MHNIYIKESILRYKDIKTNDLLLLISTFNWKKEKIYIWYNDLFLWPWRIGLIQKHTFVKYIENMIYSVNNGSNILIEWYLHVWFEWTLIKGNFNGTFVLEEN